MLREFIHKAVTNAAQAILVELYSKQFLCQMGKLTNKTKCNSSSIDCVALVTAFYITTRLICYKKFKNIVLLEEEILSFSPLEAS